MKSFLKLHILIEKDKLAAHGIIKLVAVGEDIKNQTLSLNLHL